MRHVAFPAGRLGDWDVYIDELGRERLQELEALWEVEPWGDERADRRAKLTPPFSRPLSATPPRSTRACSII